MQFAGRQPAGVEIVYGGDLTDDFRAAPIGNLVGSWWNMTGRGTTKDDELVTPERRSTCTQLVPADFDVEHSARVGERMTDARVVVQP